MSIDSSGSMAVPNTQNSLEGLPAELIVAIVLNIDRKSACALSRVSKFLSKLATPAIFRELQLYSPILSPERCRAFERGTASPTTDDLQQLKDHVVVCETNIGKMLESGERVGFHMVESILTAGASGAYFNLLNILPKLTKLRRLWIHYNGFIGLALQVDVPDNFDMRFMRHDLEIRILNQPPLFFPFLTDLRLDESAITIPAFIPLLCSRAPNLISLDFAFSSTSCSNLEDDEIFQDILGCTSFRLTRLINLTIKYYNVAYGNDDRGEMDILVNLLMNSNQIERLVIEGLRVEVYLGIENTPLAKAIDGLTRLRYLHWGGRIRDGRQEVLWDGDICSNRARCIMMIYGQWILPTPLKRNVIYMPNLETLFLDCAYRLYSSRIRTFKSNLHSDTCTFLRRCLRLSVINFCHIGETIRGIDTLFDMDELEKHTPPDVLVRSIRFCDHELLRLRFLTVDVKFLSHEPYSCQKRPTGTFTVIGRNIERDFNYPGEELQLELMSVPAWVEVTEYRGKAVPLEIIARMREVEGIVDDGVWDRRGVEVGSESWAVLEDWFDETWPNWLEADENSEEEE